MKLSEILRKEDSMMSESGDIFLLKQKIKMSYS